MAVTVGVPRETTAGENRVALVPDVVGRLKKKGLDILVEKGAGDAAFYDDADFEAQGASLVDRKQAFAADIVLKVQPPSDEEIALFKAQGVYIGMLSPLDHPGISAALAKQQVTALSMELVPRISRAQKMDALSAMSAVGGYLAVLRAANELPKFFPLLTTAAGTVKPANALVLGAGVAGLQAIATARRLGARVAAYDIRDAVKEEIQSLGATFVELELEAQDDKDSGGYANPLAEETQKRQVELLVPHIGKADVVVTTALIPGRAAPLLTPASSL
ncbi:MAG: NAD(P)(+) transhydrogenase (Re/Si-specific) subunit alpha [Bacteroidota bacterium]